VSIKRAANQKWIATVLDRAHPMSGSPKTEVAR
jgi:hypothetical protein